MKKETHAETDHLNVHKVGKKTYMILVAMEYERGLPRGDDHNKS